jgi:6-phosphogluconolactonase
MDPANNSIHIHPDLAALSRSVAERWQELSSQADVDHGQFHVALSGGTTPRHLYERLASSAFIDRIPWGCTHIYFGDERCVPPDHDDSNFHMASEALLQYVPIPSQQIHRIEAELPDPQSGAIRYEKCLDVYLPQTLQGEKYFDLVLLGLGPDGHIASLFPGSDILQEHARLVAPVYVEKLRAWRISITFAAISLARHIIILVAGENKADIIARVLGNDSHMNKFPVEMIITSAKIEWHLDSAAAALISDKP